MATFVKITDEISINLEHMVSIKKAIPNKDDPTKLNSTEYRYYATMINDEKHLLFSTTDEKESISFENCLCLSRTLKEYIGMV
jgi:hypothetical protein